MQRKIARVLGKWLFTVVIAATGIATVYKAIEVYSGPVLVLLHPHPELLTGFAYPKGGAWVDVVHEDSDENNKCNADPSSCIYVVSFRWENAVCDLLFGFAAVWVLLSVKPAWLAYLDRKTSKPADSATASTTNT